MQLLQRGLLFAPIDGCVYVCLIGLVVTYMGAGGWTTVLSLLIHPNPITP